MTGSKTTSKSLSELRAARGASKTDRERLRASGDFIWDGQDEDDRPVTREEMQAGIDAYRKKRGRPTGSHKVSTTVRFDREILNTFRATGKGWQTRMNEALRDWLKSHTP